MLKYTILFAVVAGLVFALAPTAVAGTGDTNDGSPYAGTRAPVLPPGGYPAGGYRLMFATSYGYDADQTAISWYNNEVNDVANNTGAHVGGVSTVAGLSTWKMYGATAAQPNARINLGMLALGEVGYDAALDVPIYNFAGSQLAVDNNAFWNVNGAINETDGIFDQISLENGYEYSNVPAVDDDGYAAWWSGMHDDGNAESGNELGATFVATGIGYKTLADNGDRWTDWMNLAATGVPNRLRDNGQAQWTSAYPRLRGVSDVIPEPVTMALLAFGGLGMLIRRKRR